MSTTDTESSRLARNLKAKALELGADMAGIAPAEPPRDAPEPRALEDWLSRGYAGSMEYMARDPARRSDVRRWHPEARSVLILGFRYASGKPAGRPSPLAGLFSRYSLLADYHREIKKRLKSLLSWLRMSCPSIDGRIFVDSSPVLERFYGRLAGLGWVGKNSMLISPSVGSYFFLAGISLNQELPPDEPLPDHCGSCNRCLEACPTQAFPQERVLDAARCVSYLTIEHRGNVPEPLRESVGSWVAGCDICQEVCPFNRFSNPGALFATAAAREIPLAELARTDVIAWQNRFAKTGAARIKLRGLLRNTLLAMGNSGDARHAAALQERTADADPVIAEQARWSLQRLREENPAHPSPSGPSRRGGFGRGALALLLFLSFLAGAAEAQETPQNLPESQVPEAPTPPRAVPPGAENPPSEATPWITRWMIHPISSGMFVNVPVIDEDPNRGTTAGIMPIWVKRKPGSDEIESITAPSFTGNPIYGFVGTYRYYYYPDAVSQYNVEGSLTTQIEHDARFSYQSYDFLGKDINFLASVEDVVNASQHFWGFGPDSPESNQANYALHQTSLQVLGGYPLPPHGDWKIQLYNNYSSSRISDFQVPGLVDIGAVLPGYASIYPKQADEFGGSLYYDTRDNPVTPSRGAYMNIYADESAHGVLSSYSFQRYGFDGRYLFPLATPSHPSKQTWAGQLQYQEVRGTAPLWLLPNLGGEYSSRAYGLGRYTDNGMLALNIEDRINFYARKMAGVTTVFQFAPFAGVGTVFEDLPDAAYKYLRPVVGAAIRAVVKPQVVGTVDIGIGQEGVAVFTGINYPF